MATCGVVEVEVAWATKSGASHGIGIAIAWLAIFASGAIWRFRQDTARA